jgi:hypothetical protein
MRRGGGCCLRNNRRNLVKARNGKHNESIEFRGEYFCFGGELKTRGCGSSACCICCTVADACQTLQIYERAAPTRVPNAAAVVNHRQRAAALHHAAVILQNIRVLSIVVRRDEVPGRIPAAQRSAAGCARSCCSSFTHLAALNVWKSSGTKMEKTRKTRGRSWTEAAASAAVSRVALGNARAAAAAAFAVMAPLELRQMGGGGG